MGLGKKDSCQFKSSGKRGAATASNRSGTRTKSKPHNYYYEKERETDKTTSDSNASQATLQPFVCYIRYQNREKRNTKSTMYF